MGRMKIHSCKKSGKTSMTTASFKTSTHSSKKEKNVVPPSHSSRNPTLTTSKKLKKAKEKAKISGTDAENGADKIDARIAGATTERIAEARKAEKEERARKTKRRRRAPSTLRTTTRSLPRGLLSCSKSSRRSVTGGTITHSHSANNQRILKTATNGPLPWVRSARITLPAPNNTRLTSPSAVELSS